jgi:quercetin dioxygenase-like cupin family protein
VAEERLFQRGTTLVRRLRLEPGQAMPWHRDPFHRVSVVLSGDVLAIEDRETGERHRFEVAPGQADWDEPSDRVHRGVNVGTEPYEEITIFFLHHPDDVPQPSEPEEGGKARL